MRFDSISQFFFFLAITWFVFFVDRVDSASLTIGSRDILPINNQDTSDETSKKSCKHILTDFFDKDGLLPCNEFLLSSHDHRQILCKMALDSNGMLEQPSFQEDKLLVALPVHQNLQARNINVPYSPPPFYEFRSQLEKEYEFLLIHVEIWKKITEFHTDDNQSFSPKINISFSSCESPDLKIQQHKIKHYYKTEHPNWISFNFNRAVKIACKAGGQIHISLIDKLHLEKSILINSIKIIQSNSQNHNINNSSDDEVGCNIAAKDIKCGDPILRFDSEIFSCVREIDSRCPPLTLEHIASHTCVQQCSIGEFEFMLSDGYFVCIEGFSTCNQNPLILNCQMCDTHALICLECQPGFRIEKDAQSNRLCISEIYETNGNALIKLNRILSTPDKCKRPMCEECVGDICMKCRSPLLSVHGVCYGCPRGYEIDSSTGDAYCRKSINRFACSNYDETKSTCLGCFPGTFLENSCSQHKYCLLDNEYDTYSVGMQMCGTCSGFDPKCSKCTSDNQCIACLDGWKLAIEVYGEVSPKTLCYENCPAGFYEDAFGFCAPCGVMCQVCTKDSLECLSCTIDYSIDTDYSFKYPNRRQRCILGLFIPNNCEQWDQLDTYSLCTTCQTGYTLIEGKCVQCGIGCLLCDADLVCIMCWESSSGDCPPQSCGTGQFINENMECESCMEPLACLECWNAKTCSICKPGFVLEKGVCAACPEYCSMCVNGNTCISCISGYYLNTSTGICQNNDLICQDNEYYIDFACKSCSTSCLQCSDAEYCTSCTDGDPKNGRCITCSAGQFLSDIDYTCKECHSKCLLCQPLAGCAECRAGYHNSKELNECLIVSICGDGDKVNPIVLVDSGLVGSKICDDGNVINGDGCNSNCQIEDGYECVDLGDTMTFKSVCSNKNLMQNAMTLSSRINSSYLNPIITILFELELVESNATRRRLTLDYQEMNKQRVLADSVGISKFISSSIVINISDTSADAYSYTVVIGSDYKSCDIEFEAKRNIVNKILAISFSDAFVNANSLKSSSAQIAFPETRPISMSEKLAGDAAAVIGQVASSAVLISIIPVILFSKFSFLFNALDLFQMIYYLKFLAIRLPYNIDQFLEIMSNFKVPYSMNFISWFLETNPIESDDVPEKYDDEKITGVFLKNVGDHFSQVLVIIAVHTILIGIVYASKRFTVPDTAKQSSKVRKAGDFLESKLISSWQWGWYLDKCWEMFLSVVVSCMLQFYGMYMDDVQSVINGVLFIATILAVIATPVFFSAVVHKNRMRLATKETKAKWGMLYEGLLIQNEVQTVPASVSAVNPSRSSLGEKQQFDASIESQAVLSTSVKVIQILDEKEEIRDSVKFQACKFFYIVLYLRKILFGVILVGLYDFPLVSLILIDFLNVIIVAYLAFVSPFEKKIVAWKSLACELFMIVAQFSLKFIIEDSEDADESERNSIGWVFVSACIVILTIQMVFVLSNLFKDIATKIKDFLAKKKETGKGEVNEKQEQQQQDREMKVKLEEEEDNIQGVSLKKGQTEGKKEDFQKIENSKMQQESSISELVPKNQVNSKRLAVRMSRLLITKNQQNQHVELVENDQLPPSAVERYSQFSNASSVVSTPRS